MALTSLVGSKQKKSGLFHIAVFFAYFISYLYILLRYSMNSEQSKYRYVILLVCIAIEASFCIRNNGMKFFKQAEHKSLLLISLVGIVFLVQSVVISASNGQSLPSRTIPQVFLLMSPSLYAFFLLNNVEEKSVIKIFKMALIISVVGYLCEPGHTLFEFFDPARYTNLSNFMNMMESSVFSEIFLQLFLFFNYYTYIKNDGRCKVFVYISAIFTILCNKRLAMLVVFMMPFINILLRRLKNPSKKWQLVLVVVFTVIIVSLTLLYFGLLEHRIFPDLDAYKISTGRDYILSLWKNYDYQSYGYGTSILLIGRYLELDLIEIMLELGFFSLIVFCVAMLMTAKKTYYGLMVMLICLANMLTASSLPHTAGIILMFLSIKTVEKNRGLADGKK